MLKRRPGHDDPTARMRIVLLCFTAWAAILVARLAQVMIVERQTLLDEMAQESVAHGRILERREAQGRLESRSDRKAPRLLATSATAPDTQSGVDGDLPVWVAPTGDEKSDAFPALAQARTKARGGGDFASR
ncbi:MAG: hypothetical protein A3K19_23905 [Lentisphaerae bacterium RIFOXYB12_FULL_65_16]|nr:MAG: hypothetical protein A3K18_30750 [Lentisphaerae bacterium RIFOXYA12_64_32]OGV89635.1 MAG: hypothetical protein A3K19_23905 [Lentisphaerae bacterium RIFOXYB12_FULL_65_16]